jgi:chromosomal replication initiator protein
MRSDTGIIMAATASWHEMTVAQMLADDHRPHVSVPRQIAMKLCKELTVLSYPVLARLFNRDDHTTIMHGVRRMTTLERSGDPRVAFALASLRLVCRRKLEERRAALTLQLMQEPAHV